MGKQRTGQALLWLIPLGFCLVPIGCLAVLPSLDLGFGDFDFERTSPNCLHDEYDLFLASRDGNLAEVEDLLADGADLHQQDSKGNTPLYCAAFNSHVEFAPASLRSVTYPAPTAARQSMTTSRS